MAFMESNRLTPCEESSSNRTIILKQSRINPVLYRLTNNTLKGVPCTFIEGPHTHDADSYAMLFRGRHASGRGYNLAYSPYYGTLKTFTWPTNRIDPIVATYPGSCITGAAFRGLGSHHQYVTYSPRKDSLYILSPDVHARSYEMCSLNTREGSTYLSGFLDDGISNQRNGHLFVFDDFIGFVYVDILSNTSLDVVIRFFNLTTLRWTAELREVFNLNTTSGGTGVSTGDLKWSVHRDQNDKLTINLMFLTRIYNQDQTRIKLFSEQDISFLMPGLHCRGIILNVTKNYSHRYLQGSYTNNNIVNTVRFAGKKRAELYFGEMYPDSTWHGYSIKLEKASVKRVKQTLSSLYSVLLKEGGILSPFNKKTEVEVILNTKTLEVLRKELGVPVEKHKNKIRLEEFGPEGKTVLVTLCTKDHVSGEHTYFVQKQAWENVFVKKENPGQYTDKYRILDILRYAKVVKGVNK